MQKRFSSLIAAAVICGTIIGLAPIAQAADKVDPTGTWTWSQQGRGGGDPVKVTLKLKLEGEKLTGKLSRPGRDGQVTETDIGDGKLKGEDISFTVTREAFLSIAVVHGAVQRAVGKN